MDGAGRRTTGLLLLVPTSWKPVCAAVVPLTMRMHCVLCVLAGIAINGGKEVLQAGGTRAQVTLNSRVLCTSKCVLYQVCDVVHECGNARPGHVVISIVFNFNVVDPFSCGQAAEIVLFSASDRF